MTEITAILTAYQRDYFREQVPAILGQQGVSLSAIHLWQNESHLDLDYVREYGVNLVRADHNFSYWGRFALAFTVRTEFVAIFDDDLVPGPRWLASAVRCVREHDCIAGANGRVLKGDVDTLLQAVRREEITGDDVWHQVGDNGRATADTVVDFVGHCWVFRPEQLASFFQYRPVDFSTGEDIHLGMAARLHAGIPSYVARQRNPDESAHMKDFCGDGIGSVHRPGVLEQRLRILQEWRRRGVVAAPRPIRHELFEGTMNRLRSLKKRLSGG